MRNAEYRDKLVKGITDMQKTEKAALNNVTTIVAEGLIKVYKNLLQEYDRLHPETIQVESVMIRDKRGYKNAPPQMQGCVTLFDNVNGCNVTLFDNSLSIELK